MMTDFFRRNKLLPASGAAIALLVFAPPAHAAVLYVSGAGEAAIGDNIEIRVMLDPGNSGINAVEGELAISGLEGAAEFSGVRDGGSLVDLWIERPELSNSRIRFSGVAAGRNISQPGLIFSADFVAGKEGRLSFNFSEARALAGDGAASTVELEKKGFEVSILPAREVALAKRILNTDNEPPYGFEAAISKNEAVPGGKYFAVFNARDNDTGIAGFQIMEVLPFGAWPVVAKKTEWRDCQNPCVLEDQTLKSALYAKVFDRAGNYKIIFIEPQRRPAWFENIFISGIVGLFLATAILFFFKLYKKDE